MQHVLIIEPHEELATALGDVIASAHFLPVVRRHVDQLSDLGFTPVTIVLRIGHADVSSLPFDRPPIIAIVSSDEDVAEATRLRCEVVLRAPGEVRRLRDVIQSLAAA
jgi:hypothetical protein